MIQITEHYIRTGTVPLPTCLVNFTVMQRSYRNLSDDLLLLLRNYTSTYGTSRFILNLKKRPYLTVPTCWFILTVKKRPYQYLPFRLFLLKQTSVPVPYLLVYS